MYFEAVPRRLRRSIITLVAILALAVPSTAYAQSDPREGLAPGHWDAESVTSGLHHIGLVEKRNGTFYNPASPFASAMANSDMAIQGDLVIMGNYHGFQIFDASGPGIPILRTEVACPGGQGDVSVYGNLLFFSAEETRARVDCGTQGNPGGAQASRFRGIRIFDISDITDVRQVGGVQTCRGSHTHTIVEDLDDPDHIYIYNSGAAGQRNAAEAVHTPAGLVTGRCGGANSSAAPVFDDRPTFLTEVIKVPLANPAGATVIREARLFTNPETGQINALQNGPTTPLHPSGETWFPVPDTNTCHDITAYPEIGLAAGACQGNGVLIDISDPADPRRLDAVADPNFAYWHSATFNNDGTTVLFTDEWWGAAGSKCRIGDQLNWGANGIYDIVQTENGLEMEFRSYYKMPSVQQNNERCTTHNGSLVPIPGRDIMAQAYYQGGITLWDFTDSSNPVEIAFFDRGPYTATQTNGGGLWSTYWYNGRIFGTEMYRGLDVWELVETGHISAAEIAAALEVVKDRINPQAQTSFAWGPSTNVIGAHRDQLLRAGAISDREVLRVDEFLEQVDAASTPRDQRTAAAAGRRLADRLDADTQTDLIAAILLVVEDIDP